MLSRALDKAGVGNAADFVIDHNILESAYHDEVANGRVSIFDWDDRWRIGQLACEERRPYDLVSSAREGLIDDFFGAWLNRDDNIADGAFDPDEASRLLPEFN